MSQNRWFKLFCSLLFVCTLSVLVYLKTMNKRQHGDWIAVRDVKSSRMSRFSNVSYAAKTYRNFTFYKVEQKELFVFSAYYDRRFGKLIRFVGMAVHQDYRGLKCLIQNRGQMEATAARVEYLPEGHSMRYDAVYVLCSCRRELSGTASVGLAFGTAQSSFFIPVQTIPLSPTSLSKELSLCYPPLHSGFDNVQLFVENIEMNRLLGFRHFFVYVLKVGEHVRRAIDIYRKAGIVTEISWANFPLVSGGKYPVPGAYVIHYFGQMVAINDCLYRAMNRPNRIVAFHDFDELIIPHVANTSLTDIAVKEMGSSFSGLSVRCAMFDLRYPDDAEASHKTSSRNPRLVTQLKTKRNAKIFPHRDRSKMLVKADNVITMGIHFVWRYRQYGCKNLNPSTALLHHYRSWNNADGVVDRTAVQYGSMLKNFVEVRLQQLKL